MLYIARLLNISMHCYVQANKYDLAAVAELDDFPDRLVSDSA